MTLYLIGIGLFDEKDITLRGLGIIKKCRRVYLETYTSRLNCSVGDLEKAYGKEIIPVGREFVEHHADELLDAAKKSDVALLIVGSPTSATTHMELFLEAKKKKVNVGFVENASVITAVGMTGLSLYKFGRITTIPFQNKNITSPIEIIRINQKHNFHTLVLLDIEGDRLMTIKEGLDYLIRNGMPRGQLCVGCAALGSPEPQIRAAKANELLNYLFTKFPQCLIIPAKLHFKEEEVLNIYS